MENQKYIAPSTAKFKLYITSNIYSSILAGFATAPIVLYHFFIFSNYSILTNLIAVPMMSFVIMPLALINFFLMPFHLEYYALKLLGFSISIIVKVAAFIVALPHSVINFGYITNVSFCIYLFGLFWLCLWRTHLRLFGYIIIIGSVLLMFLSPKPDLIIDRFNKILIVKKEDHFIAYSKRPPFFANYWGSWLGENNIEYKKTDILTKNYVAKMSNGENISVCFKKQRCLDNAIVINIFDSSIFFYNTSILVPENENILVFCKKTRCEIKFN